MKKEDIKINIEVDGRLTGSELSIWEDYLKKFGKKFSVPVQPDPTESAKRLKEAVKQAEYDQCSQCGNRRFEKVVNKVIITSGYYFKSGKMQDGPGIETTSKKGRKSVLRCSECETIYNKKERMEGL